MLETDRCAYLRNAQHKNYILLKTAVFNNLIELTEEPVKGTRRMPWLSEARKDAASCEKPGQDAHSL